MCSCNSPFEHLTHSFLPVLRRQNIKFSEELIFIVIFYLATWVEKLVFQDFTFEGRSHLLKQLLLFSSSMHFVVDNFVDKDSLASALFWHSFHSLSCWQSCWQRSWQSFHTVFDTVFDKGVDKVFDRVVDSVVDKVLDIVVDKSVDSVVDTVVDTVVDKCIDTVVERHLIDIRIEKLTSRPACEQYSSRLKIETSSLYFL